jgi:hypothetical protein
MFSLSKEFCGIQFKLAHEHTGLPGMVQLLQDELGRGTDEDSLRVQAALSRIAEHEHLCAFALGG